MKMENHSCYRLFVKIKVVNLFSTLNVLYFL